MESNKVYLLCGAPGAGKTTFGKALSKSENAVRICPDEIRAEIGTGEGDQSVSGRAFMIARERMETALKDNKHVIIDATNMHRKGRKEFLEIAKKYLAITTALVFECTKETLVERNRKRGEQGGRTVPEEIIDIMIQKYQRPDTIEFDKVQFVSKLEP